MPPSTLRLVIVLALLIAIVAPSWMSGQMALRKGQDLAKLGHLNEAAYAYANAARLLIWQPTLWEQAGLLAMAAGNVDQAEKYLERARDHAALSPPGWIAYGDLAYQAKQIELARQRWERALPFAEAHRRLARLEQQQGNLQEAISYWKALLADKPEDPEANYQLGLFLIATDPHQALPYLLRAAQQNPALDEAVHILRTSLNQATHNEETWFFYGGLGLSALGEWELAQRAFYQAVSLAPEEAIAWAWLGEARQRLGLDGEAQIREALRLGANLATVQALYGLYLQRQGQTQTAVNAFHQAINLEPHEAGWHAALASAYEQDGDLVAALQYYQQAIQLAPQDLVYYRALVAFCLRHTIYLQELALPTAQKILELSPDDWHSHDLLAQVLLALGDSAGARAELQIAIQKSPSQLEIYLHLAQSYLQDGNTIAACHTLAYQAQLNSGTFPTSSQRLWEQFCSSSNTP